MPRRVAASSDAWPQVLAGADEPFAVALAHAAVEVREFVAGDAVQVGGDGEGAVLVGLDDLVEPGAVSTAGGPP